MNIIAILLAVLCQEPTSPSSMARNLLAGFVGQDETRQDATFKLDEKGDCTIEVQFTLSAQNWLRWKNNFGDHPDLMRRDFVRGNATLVVEDYKVEMDAMNRKAKASVRALGGARYKGSGKFEVVLPADWSKVTDTGAEWHFSHAETAGRGSMLKMVNKVVLPPGASGAKLSGPVDGQQILSYEMPRKGGFNPMLLFSGIGLVMLILVTVMRFAAGGGAPGAQPVKG